MVTFKSLLYRVKNKMRHDVSSPRMGLRRSEYEFSHNCLLNIFVFIKGVLAVVQVGCYVGLRSYEIKIFLFVCFAVLNGRGQVYECAH